MVDNMEATEARRRLLLISLFVGILGGAAAKQRPSASSSARGPTETQNRNFYDFTVKTIDGIVMELDEYRGQVCDCDFN